MFRSLCAILEPPAPRALPRRTHARRSEPDCDSIPIITRRGRRLTVRTVAASDTPLLAELLTSMSEEALRRRFFRPLMSAEAIDLEAARAAGGDPRLRVVLVATARENGIERAVALAEVAHDPHDSATAEFAIIVRDDYQQEGLGRILTQLAVQVALLRDVARLRAGMLADNLPIQKLVHGLGLPYTSQRGWGEVTSTLALTRD